MVKLCVYKPCRPGVTWPCFDRNLARQHERANLLFYVVTDDGCWSRRDSLRVRLATRFSLEYADGAVALTVQISGALVALGEPFSLVSLIDHPRILGSAGELSLRAVWMRVSSRDRARSRAFSYTWTSPPWMSPISSR